MKIVTVVGARPQFIKAAVVSDTLQKNHTEILVHTGQHYDYNMSQQFFEQLEIPAPAYNLGISGGTHAEMTGRMLIALEKVLLQENPDWLLVYGDTNSTLAAGLAAAKLHIPICHVEAGVRIFCHTNPEEINRICVDHLSSLLLTSTAGCMENLKKEGLSSCATPVGDPMYDAFLKYCDKLHPQEIRLSSLYGKLCKLPEEYYYLTCHREENTIEDSSLLEIFKAMECLDAPVIYPVHPRNKSRALRLAEQYSIKNTILAEPVGYLESLCLLKYAKKVITDSGGLQREAFFAEKKCVTILDFVCWPETMCGGRNQLALPKAADILEKLNTPQEIDPSYLPFGNGHSAEKIADAMEHYKERRNVI